MNYQDRFAAYLQSQSPGTNVTPSVAGSVTGGNIYQDRFAAYLRNQSSTPTVTPSATATQSASGNLYQKRFAAYLQSQSSATNVTPSVTRTAATAAAYKADDAAIGQYGKGNIDLYHRPQYRYDNGAIATVESMSFNEDGKEILVPTIAFDNAGKAVKLTDEQAIDRYHQTGEYLGKFNTVAEADSYAEQLHRAQDYYYNERNAKSALTNLSSDYGGYMPSLNPTSKRGSGYMGYGLEAKLPETAQSGQPSNAWRGLTKEIGSYVDSVRDASAARGIQTAVGNENIGREDNTRYGQYLRLMTPEEREKATHLESQGGLSEKERGAYIRSLNLDERILSGAAKERAEKASQYETRTAEAKKSDSLYGRLIATFVTGDYSYSAQDFQGSDPGPAPEKMRFLTEKQKDTLNAYIKAGDFQAVGDYYKTLEPSLNQQHAEWEMGLAKDLTANSTLADVVAVPVTGALNAFGGIPSYLATAGHVLKDAATGNYSPIDKNSEAYAIPRFSQALQEGMNSRISSIQDPNIRYVAKLATSGLSSGVSNLIQLYTGQALGLQGQALAEFITVTMSASAGGQDAYRNLVEGQSNGDAFLNATASAVIEYWTEHMTTSRWIENLGKLKSGNLSKADIVKMISTQTASEMWEEVVGNVADQSWDRLYNGENSVFSRRIQELTGAGLSREDAETQAFKELYVNQSVEAALSVAFSMILMDGAPAVSNHISYVDAGRNLRKSAGQGAVANEIEKGLLFAADSPAHTLAEQLQSAQAAGGVQTVSNHDLGRLSFLNGQAVSELMSGIEDGDNEVLKYAARAILNHVQDNPTDRVSVSQIQMLRELHEGAKDGQTRTDAERSERESLFNDFRQDFFSQISRIDLDAAGNPLVSYEEAVNEIRARMPDATEEQIRQFYSQYRDETRTVLFGGHRLTRAQFRSLMQEATPEKLSGVDLDRLFNMAILDTLDGSDAFERYLPGVTEGARQQTASPAQTGNFSLDENEPFAESYENAPQSPESANADADSVSGEKAIDESVAKPANSVAAESVTPGLNYEDAVTAEAANNLDGRTADKIDTLGKMLGKRIRFANSVAEGAANGQIAANDITLDRSLLDEGAEPDALVWKILGHELTHGVQQDAPEAYAAFRDAVMSEESFRAHVADIRSAYEMRGLFITEEAALDEATADYGGDIMRNTDTAERFIERNRQNRTLLQKIRDAIVNLVRKLTGAEKRQARTVQSLFDAALDAAAQNVREDAAQTDSAAAQYNGDIRFSVKTVNGKSVVWIDSNPLSKAQLRKGSEVENYLKQHIGEVYTLIESGQNVYLGADLPTEYAYSEYSKRIRRSDRKINRAKGRAASDLGELIENSTNRRWEKTNHPKSKDAKYGIYRYDVSFAFPMMDNNGNISDVYVYDAEVIIRNASDGKKYLYDLVHIKENTTAAQGLLKQATRGGPKAAARGSVSSTNITQTAQNSNTQTQKNSSGVAKPSLKGTEDSEKLRKLVEENKRLTERVKFWREQTQLSDPKQQPRRAVIGEVDKAARSILKQFDSALDVKDIRPAVLELVQHMNKGPEGEGAWSPTDNGAAEQAAVAEWISKANGMARTLAAQIINHARVLTNDADMKVVRDIREEVRKAPLSYNRAAIAERTNFSEFWKRNRSRLKLQNKNGMSIESRWEEWSKRFGEEWFPSSLADETEMLLCLDQIMDALEHIQPEYINPHNADMLDAIEKCREVILDVAMDTGPRARTFADRQKAARGEAYQKGVEEGQRRAQAAVESAKRAVEKERERSRRNMDAYRERVKERNKAREAAQINRQRWVQLNRLMKRLNNRKMLQADRTVLNAIYENLEAIANNTLGVTPEDIEANMKDLWMKISEYGGVNEEGESIPGRNPLYSERFIRNPKAFAEVLKQRRQTTERMKDLERETAELSPEQLQRVCEFLMAFDHAQATIDQLINARDKRDLALQAALLQEHLRGATPFLANGLITEMLRPVSFAARATGYAQNDPFVNSVKDLVEGERIRDDYKRRAYALILNRFAVNLGNSPSVTKQMSAAEQRQLVRKIEALMKTFSGKDAAAKENLIEIHGTDPGAEAFSDKPVTAHITKGMRMGLYLHSKNNDNMRHITQGGFKVPSVEKGGYEFYRKENYAEAYANNHAVRIRLTKAEVERIVSGMSAEEKAFADAVSYYYDTMSKKELTRVHETLKGWSPFNVENYMPIETDDAFNHVDYETMQTDGTMSTPGFSLERVKSGKAVILRDLNLTAFNSVEQHAKFIGLAIPVRNMNKLLNWSRVTRGSVEQAVERMYGKESAEKVRARFEQRSGEGETALALPGEQAQLETDNTLSVLREVLGWKKTKSLQDFLNENAKYESVRETVRASLGEAGTRYIDKLMKDMTGQKKSQDKIGRVLSELTSNLAGAALTLNGSTAAVQTASFPTAAAAIGWAPLLKTLQESATGKRKPVNLKIVNAYTSRLWERSQGFTTHEADTLTSREPGLPKGANWIQAMDVGTTTLLWSACEHYVEQTMPELAADKGSEQKIMKGESDFYRAVAETYNNVIELTQPSYGTMERSQILRSDNELVRMTNMFKTQMYQNFNILYDAIGERNARVQEYSVMKDADTKAALHTANVRLANAVTSQFAASLMAAFIRFGWGLLFRKDDRYRNEEGKLSVTSVGKRIALDTVGLFPGMVAYLGDIVSAFAALSDRILKSLDKEPFFNETFYGVGAAVFDEAETVYNQTSGAIAAIVSFAHNVRQGLENDEGKVSWQNLIGKVLKAGSGIAQLSTGFPVKNLTNILRGMAQWSVTLVESVATGDISKGRVLGDYLYLHLTADPKKDAREYYDLLFETGNQKFYADANGKNAPDNYRTLYRQMITDGFDADKMQAAMKSRWMKTKNYTVNKDRFAGLLTGTALASPAYWRLDETQREELKENIQKAAQYETFRDYADGYSETDSESRWKWMRQALSLNETHKIPLTDLLILRSGTHGITGIKETDALDETEDDETGQGSAISGSKGLQIMETAYDLFPEMEKWDDEKRQAVFEWLGVGKTIIWYSRDAVSNELDWMRTN